MEEGNLENAALQRKARLQALKEKSKASEGKGAGKEKLKFRSYNPQDEDLKEKKLPKGRPEEVTPQIEDQLEAAKDSELGDIDFTNLAPRKVDWDLKRDIQKKLDKLERRTQRAIIEILHEKFKGATDSDLATAVAVAGRENNEQTYDSD